MYIPVCNQPPRQHDTLKIINIVSRYTEIVQTIRSIFVGDLVCVKGRGERTSKDLHNCTCTHHYRL